VKRPHGFLQKHKEDIGVESNVYWSQRFNGEPQEMGETDPTRRIVHNGHTGISALCHKCAAELQQQTIISRQIACEKKGDPAKGRVFNQL